MNSTFLTVNQNILLNNTYYKWLIYIMNLQYQLNQSKSKDFLQISYYFTKKSDCFQFPKTGFEHLKGSSTFKMNSSATIFEIFPYFNHRVLIFMVHPVHPF